MTVELGHFSSLAHLRAVELGPKGVRGYGREAGTGPPSRMGAQPYPSQERARDLSPETRLPGMMTNSSISLRLVYIGLFPIHHALLLSLETFTVFLKS